MAKRFTDTDKWKKPFIRGLAAPYKLLWFYLCDDCDHAGIWQVDFEVAAIRIGEPINIETARSVFADKIIELDGGEKWFLPSFVEFQNPSGLNEKNNAHSSIITILKKYDLIDSENKIKPLTSPLQGAQVMVMDKVIVPVMDNSEAKVLKKSDSSNRNPELQNPFSPEFLTGIWETWKEYRKDKKCPIKSVKSENITLKHLHKLASGSEQTAISMLEKAISNGWQGFDYAAPGTSGNGTRPQTENQRLNDIARNGGHLKTDDKKWVQIRGKITQGEFELDGEGNLVMYCGRETLKVYPGEGYRSNVLYDLKPGNTIQEVHKYLLSERKLQIAV